MCSQFAWSLIWTGGVLEAQATGMYLSFHLIDMTHRDTKQSTVSCCYCSHHIELTLASGEDDLKSNHPLPSIDGFRFLTMIKAEPALQESECISTEIVQLLFSLRHLHSHVPP